MLSSFADRAGELLAFAAFAGMLVAAVMAGGLWWLGRRIRRRVGVLGLAMAGRARQAVAHRTRQAVTGHAQGYRAPLRPSATAGAGPWLWSRPLPDRRWLAAGLSRRRLWRAVGAAEHSVALAQEAGAPVGDLRNLCARLHQAAGDADRSLAMLGRATARGADLDAATAHVSALMSAAGQIQGAAAHALASMSRPEVSALAGDVRREVVALSAGIASAVGEAGTRPLPQPPV